MEKESIYYLKEVLIMDNSRKVTNQFCETIASKFPSSIVTKSTAEPMVIALSDDEDDDDDDLPTFIGQSRFQSNIVHIHNWATGCESNRQLQL